MTGSWVAKLITPAAQVANGVDEISERFITFFADRYNIDCNNDPLQPIRLDNLSEEQKSRIRNIDYYQPDTEEHLSTGRLQYQLENWVNQNMPRLVAPQYSSIKPNMDKIEELTFDIHQTLSDYVDFGIITGHAKPSLDEVREMLENYWQQTLAPFTTPVKEAPDRAA